MQVDTAIREDSSPPDASGASTPVPAYTYQPLQNRKRKHAAISSANGSPAPPDASVLGAQAAGASVLTGDSSVDEDKRPRLTVSRKPVFCPAFEWNNERVYSTTDQIAVNRLGFRYIPAGLTPVGYKTHYRMIESQPEGYVRVSWEDRSPFVKVTEDGLGLCGEKGYRSARLNVPVREGKWYLEVKIEFGGGDKEPDSTAKEGAHVRLGWGRREAMLNCPVGLDGYSYGLLDKDGRKVTLSRPRSYGKPFKTGDVIGLYISLPPKREANPEDPLDPAQLKRERIAIDFKGQAYFESVEYPQSREMIALMDAANSKLKEPSPPAVVNNAGSSSTGNSNKKPKAERGNGKGKPATPEPAPLRPLVTLEGSRVAFFINGECQGTAFEDIYDYLQLRQSHLAQRNKNRRKPREGIVEHTDNPFDDGWLGYYPFISLFNSARVLINAGPNFDFPPPADIDAMLSGSVQSPEEKSGERTWRPLCERYGEFVQEQRDLDERDEAKAREAPEERQATVAKKEETTTNSRPTKASQPKARRAPTQKSKASAKARASSIDIKPEPSLSALIDPVLLQADAALLTPSANDEKPPDLGEGCSSNSTSTPTVPVSSSVPGAIPNISASNGEHFETEEERKLAARRERKRELERARRARQREEKQRQKQLAAEESLKKAEEAAQAAAMAAAQARMAAAGFAARPLTSFSMSVSPLGTDTHNDSPPALSVMDALRMNREAVPMETDG